MDRDNPDSADERLERVEDRVDDLEGELMGTQAEVDADTQALVQAHADLEAAKGSLQTELNNLQAQVNAGNVPDLTAMTAAVQGIEPPVQAIGALKPEAAKPAAAAHPLYTFTGDPTTVDAALWIKTAKTTSDGKALYEYAHDAAGGAPTGQSAGVWDPYTGPVTG